MLFINPLSSSLGAFIVLLPVLVLFVLIVWLLISIIRWFNRH